MKYCIEPIHPNVVWSRAASVTSRPHQGMRGFVQKRRFLLLVVRVKSKEVQLAAKARPCTRFTGVVCSTAESGNTEMGGHGCEGVPHCGGRGALSRRPGSHDLLAFAIIRI